MRGRSALFLLSLLVSGTHARADVLVNDRSGDPAGASQNAPRVATVFNNNTIGKMVVVAWSTNSVPATQSRARLAVAPIGNLAFTNDGAPPAPASWVWSTNVIVRGAAPAIDVDGICYVAGNLRLPTNPPNVGVGFVRAFVNTPGSVTFDSPKLLVNFGNAEPNIGFLGIVDMQVHPADGAIFVAYAPYALLNDAHNVYFMRSSDGGANWSQPVQVSSDSTRHPTSPLVLCGENAGDVSFFWQQSDATGFSYEIVSRHSTNGGSTLGPPTVVMTYPTAYQFPPSHGGGLQPVVDMQRYGGIYGGASIVAATVPFDLRPDVFPSVGSTGAVSESEPNGSSATANSASLGDVLRGMVTTAFADTDCFAFTLAQGQEVNVLGDSLPVFTGTSQLDLDWIGPDGHSYLTSYFMTGPNPQWIGFVAPTSGTYTMRVAANVPGAYRLRTVLGSAPPSGASDQRDVAVSRLPTGGSWSGMQVETFDPVGNDATGIALAPCADGALYLSYNDFSVTPGRAISRRVLRRSADAGATWSGPVTLSTANTDWAATSSRDGWWCDMASDGVNLFTVWTDARNGDPDVFLDYIERRIYVTSNDPFTATAHPGETVHAVRNVRNADHAESFDVRMAPDGSSAGWSLAPTSASLGPGVTAPLDCVFQVPADAAPGDVTVNVFYQSAASPHTTYGLAPLALHVAANTAVDPGGPSTLALAPIRPNPVDGPCTVRFSLARAGRVRLAIYGVDGRVVRTLVDGGRPAGAQEAAWDGADAGGRRSPAGAYFIVLKAEGRTLTRRMVVLR